MNKEKAMTNRTLRVGFLTYDLQEFTADCLARVNTRAPFRLKAYPILPRAAKPWINFAYRPSNFKARYVTLSRPGKTPEGLMMSVNPRAAIDCVKENDVVVLFGIQGGTALLAAVLARLMRRKLVSVNQTLPARCERQRRWWVRWLKGWVLRRCRIHVVETPTTHETLATVYGLRRETFVEAPFEAGFGVFQKHIDNLKQSRDVIRRELAWNPKECVFLFTGTLLPFKGIETMLQAALRLRNMGHAFRVVLCGPEAGNASAPTLDDYRRQAEELGVEQEVIFTDRLTLEQLSRYYRAADVFLLPTQKDCWPKVLVEAAACRLPLITTTSCGASGSLVTHGKTGLIVPPGDPEALTLAMVSMLDPKQRERMGQEAYNFCIDFCDPVKQAEGYVEAVRRAA